MRRSQQEVGEQGRVLFYSSLCGVMLMVIKDEELNSHTCDIRDRNHS